MNNPEVYIKINGMQRSSAKELISTFFERMTWKPNETVLDFGCGPGDVTSNILYPVLRKNIKLLVGIDISQQMVEYATKTYECSEIVFKVLDIENSNVIEYKHSFNKIFSFFCFHWVKNKLNALTKMYSMLESKGEILISFLLKNPFFEFYKHIDVEWVSYVRDVAIVAKHSPEEVKDFFIKAGFRIISIDLSVKHYLYPDFSSVLDFVKGIDGVYKVLPLHLRERYFTHVKSIISEKNVVSICPITGKARFEYHPITVHAIKD